VLVCWLVLLCTISTRDITSTVTVTVNSKK
jgi:hypothetical protein